MESESLDDRAESLSSNLGTGMYGPIVTCGTCKKKMRWVIQPKGWDGWYVAEDGWYCSSGEYVARYRHSDGAVVLVKNHSPEPLSALVLGLDP